MPLLFLGFLFLMLAWLFWAMVWAAALLFWPVTLLIAGALLWRAHMRRSQRLIEIRPGDVDGRPAPPRRNGALHSGAFEAYRQETMARLSEEQGKFREFLDRLRKSREKQEFDAFMRGRRGRPGITQGDAPAA